MDYLFLALFYSLSGFLMKLSDDAYDEQGDKKIAVLSGIFSGILIGYLVVNSHDAAYIFLAIMLGSLLSRKIDGVHHFLTLITFLVLTFIGGFPSLGFLTLSICTLAAYLDELGHDNIILKKHDFWMIFFKYRFTLKLIIFLLGILTFLKTFNIFNPVYLDLLNPSAIVYFLLFEISYELSGYSFNQVYKIIYTFSDNIRLHKLIFNLKKLNKILGLF